MLVAHRGASAYAPENTIAAFDLALRHRADAIECDTRLTADGVPVLCHDATLERIAGRPDRVADLSLADLKSIDAGAWKGPEWAGMQVFVH